MGFTDKLTAKRTIPRAEAAAIATFAAAPVGNVVDALGRSGAMDHRLKPITRADRFAGAALTVDAGPGDNLAPWAALRLAEPGDVLVIATGLYAGHSVCGDILVGMAKNAGIAAVVTDGVVRDITGLNAVGIPVFAMGVSPNSPQKDGPGSVGLPVICGGIPVGAGDIVCGDEDGVVVVPAARIEAAQAALATVREKETQMEAAARSGAPAPSWLSGLALDEIFTFID